MEDKHCINVTLSIGIYTYKFNSKIDIILDFKFITLMIGKDAGVCSLQKSRLSLALGKN